MTRYKIVCDCVERWCRTFELPPWFWRMNLGGQQIQSRILTNPAGNAEDIADCMAMIVGTLGVKGFRRQELMSYLSLGHDAVWRYQNHYSKIPEDTKRVLIQIDGERAPHFWRSILIDYKAQQIERLQENREWLRIQRNRKEQKCRTRSGTSRRPSRTGDSR